MGRTITDAKHAADTGRVDPRAMTAEEAARLLAVPVEVIARHIEAGAPCDIEGRLHLVHYAAWLVARLSFSKSSNPPRRSGPRA